MKIRFVLFDCMDTLIQMDIPSLDVYPLWAYEVASRSGLWPSPGDFHAAWIAHRHHVIQERGSLSEFTLRERLEFVADRASSIPELDDDSGVREPEIERIRAGYWSRYLEASFLTPGAREALDELAGREDLGLGVLSNFIVPGGVGELLARHELADHFRVVISSAALGWKKPAEQVYRFASHQVGVPPGEILFVGDNPMADFDGPRLCGFRPLLFDPRDEHPDYEPRIRSLTEVPAHLDAS